MSDSQEFIGRVFNVGTFYAESDFFGFNELHCSFFGCRYFQHPENLHCMLLVRSHDPSLLLIDILRADPAKKVKFPVSLGSKKRI